MSPNEQSSGGAKRLSRGWRFTIYAFVIIGGVAVFYGEENWRGKQAWEKFSEALARKGAPVNPAAVVPPPVPDEQNFAQTPFLAPLFDFETGNQRLRDTNALARIRAFTEDFDKAMAAINGPKMVRSNSWVGAPIDLATFNAAMHGKKTETQQISNPAADPAEQARAVLQALSKYDPVLDELRQASQRPHSRFDIAYDYEDPAAVLLPHLAVLKQMVQLLRVRAQAELAAGLPDRALEDINLCFSLLDSTRNEPIIISHLVRLTELHLILQPLGQGLQQHQWTAPQLSALQARLQQLNFCLDARRALEGERVLFGGGIIDYIRRSRNQFQTVRNLGLGEPNAEGSSGFDATAVAVAVIPDGWLFFEKVNYERRLFEDVLPLIPDQARRIDPDQVHRLDTSLQKELSLGPLSTVMHHRVLTRWLLPALSKIAEKTAYGQTAADQAMLACALERFRLKQGSYPERLEQLAPEFVASLSVDIVTGEPLKYRRTDDGRFVLYSVGWNKTDEGGQVAMHKGGWTVDEQAGDWVWQ